MGKAVIYTVLIGNYDKFPQYKRVNSYFDYVCFSDQFKEGEIIGQWKIRNISNSNISKYRLTRLPKLLPHLFFPDYDYSVYIDANVLIESDDIYCKILENIDKGILWGGIQHPLFNCLYQDLYIGISLGKAKPIETNKLRKFLKKEGYPKENGLFENNFIIRKHNEEIVKKIDEEWWEMYMRFAPRDQYSLFYVFWKNNFNPELLFKPEENTKNLSGIKRKKHTPLPLWKRPYNKIKIRSNQLFYRFLRLF